MLALSDFRTKAKGLPDLLTYAGLIDPGIVLQKDGSFLAGWEVRGRDTDSSTHEELNYVAVQFNNAVKSLGTGWMLHVSAARNTQQAGICLNLKKRLSVRLPRYCLFEHCDVS